MQTKPKSNSWADLKMLFAAGSLVATLWLWNLFAETNDQKNGIQQSAQTVDPPAVEQSVMPQVKILLGGPAPRVYSAPQRTNGNRNQNSEATTRTGSSK